MNQLEAFPEAQLFPDEEPDERYTLLTTIELCKRIAGVSRYDLDVAACGESHWADRWFSREQNGLEQPWAGHVWCNPPYSSIRPWVEKACSEWSFVAHAEPIKSISMLLPANRTEQPWWQELVELRRDRRWDDIWTHFLPGRVKFGHPGNPEGKGVGSPPFGCVLLVWKD